MKILTIHADFIEFEAKKKAFKGAEEGIQEGKHRIEECLVIFTAFEKRDESNVAAVLDRYLQEIKNVALQVNAKNLVLYPYAHLSSQLGNPAMAEKLMKDAEKRLSDKYKVVRAPFGWYKSFNISCKGHPLSELSREFSVENAPVEPSKESSLKREYKDENFQFIDRKLSHDEKILLSAAQLIAAAVKKLYPQAELGSSNVHQDQAYVDIKGVKLRNDDIPRIEKEAAKIRNMNLSFTEGGEATGLQKEIQKDLGTKAMAFTFNGFAIVPAYPHPFVSNSHEIKSLRITNLSSAYWKNNEKNTQLTRIYSVGFDAEEKAEAYLKKQQDAENRSHLKIGKEQGLFVVSELVGAGMPLLAPRGTILRNEIIRFLWELHKNEGYQQVWTPHITKPELYKTSGHWEKFGAELFKVKGRDEEFVMKPMSCPHHMQIFSHFSYSYRDLPIRFFEAATVYRDEKSGQLIGLSRVRAITQDDGHLFCRVSQITEEASKIVRIIHQFYHTLGMDAEYWVSLSVRGEDKSKYLGTDEVWKIAENALERAAKEMKLPYRRIEGEAAFYGPKLDFLFKDALGREWQLATIQCDFNLPERFQLSYMNEESKKERPVVIHRAISGSLERFMSILIEHFAGKFPLWLNPIQVKILTVTDRNIVFAEEILAKLRSHDIRAELDDRSESIGKKVRDAQLEKVNYMITIGDKEVEKKTLAVRDRVGQQRFDVNIDEFVQELVTAIKERKL